MKCIKVRGVVAGDTVVMECEGGFVRRPADQDGIMIESNEIAVFLSVPEVERALEQIKLFKSFRKKK